MKEGKEEFIKFVEERVIPNLDLGEILERFSLVCPETPRLEKFFPEYVVNWLFPIFLPFVAFTSTRSVFFHALIGIIVGLESKENLEEIHISPTLLPFFYKISPYGPSPDIRIRLRRSEYVCILGAAKVRGVSYYIGVLLKKEGNNWYLVDKPEIIRRIPLKDDKIRKELEEEYRKIMENFLPSKDELVERKMHVKMMSFDELREKYSKTLFVKLMEELLSEEERERLLKFGYRIGLPAPVYTDLLTLLIKWSDAEYGIMSMSVNWNTVEILSRGFSYLLGGLYDRDSTKGRGKGYYEHGIYYSTENRDFFILHLKDLLKGYKMGLFIKEGDRYRILSAQEILERIREESGISKDRFDEFLNKCRIIMGDIEWEEFQEAIMEKPSSLLEALSSLSTQKEPPLDSSYYIF